MTPAATNAWLMLLSALAGGFAALAASLWWSERRFPRARVFDLTRDLIERQQALETLIRQLAPSPEPLEAGDTRSSAERPRPTAAISRAARTPAPAADPAGPDLTLIQVPDLTPRPHAAPAAELELARRFGSIWDQADAGAPPSAIAQQFGLPIGQVELILGLRRQLGGVASEARA